MHIQEGTNTNLTTCTKMTEEVDRRNGVNGNSSSKGASEDAPVNHSALTATGGRLKFFKDGKFILELVRGCAREGERPGWVSVPRKTFWPPTPPAPRAHSASLSVSDDNSSLHSSPWQRDHCWKQPTPRRNLSRDLNMYYCRPTTLGNEAIAAATRIKRRRPLDPSMPPSAAASPRADDTEDPDRARFLRMKLKRPSGPRPRVRRRTQQPPLRRGELARVVDRLRERLVALPAPVNAKLASCRQQEHAMVSPRKRILRELERVSLEESKRRARPAPALSTASYPPAASSSSQACVAAPPPAPARRAVSSYSIHSLLSLGEENARPPPPPEPWVRAAPRHDVYYPYYGSGAAVYRPPPLWMQYALPAAPPPPWPPRPHPLISEHMPRDDTPDLPLNLSKH